MVKSTTRTGSSRSKARHQTASTTKEAKATTRPSPLVQISKITLSMLVKILNSLTKESSQVRSRTGKKPILGRALMPI